MADIRELRLRQLQRLRKNRKNKDWAKIRQKNAKEKGSGTDPGRARILFFRAIHQSKKAFEHRLIRIACERARRRNSNDVPELETPRSLPQKQVIKLDSHDYKRLIGPDAHMWRVVFAGLLTGISSPEPLPKSFSGPCGSSFFVPPPYVPPAPPLIGIEENPGPRTKGGKKKKGKKRVAPDATMTLTRGARSMANLMPDTHVLWMEYNFPTNELLAAAASNFAFLNLHPNDIFRPVVGTAVAYTGLTAITTFYNLGIVLAWELDWEFVNADAAPKEVYCIPNVTDLTGTVVSATTANFYVGERQTPQPRLIDATGGMSRGTIKVRLNTPKFFGDPELYHANYAFVCGASPANFINCGLAAVTATVNMTLGLMCRLKLRAKVKFYSRKPAT
jgi:hypothetical protein